MISDGSRMEQKVERIFAGGMKDLRPKKSHMRLDPSISHHNKKKILT